MIPSAKIAKIVLDCPCGSFPQTLSPCVYFESYQKPNNSQFYCKSNQEFFSSTFFNKHFKPFENIPADLFRGFLVEHQDEFSDKLDSQAFMRALRTHCLISRDELHKINELEKCEKVSFLLQTLPSNAEEWAENFYNFLKSKDGVQMLGLFKSFILKSLNSRRSVAELCDFKKIPF